METDEDAWRMKEVFGRMPSGEPVYRVALENQGMRVRIIGLGAAIQSIEIPDRQGRRANVVLGLEDLATYIERSPHFGAVPGRYAGRIGQGRFSLDGVEHHLSVNSPPNTLHGGFKGFGRRNWTLVDHGPDHVAFTLVSPDGDEGFPGRVTASAHYRLQQGALRLDLRAETDRPTVVNLTNHAYFNLAGEGAGTVFDHTLRLAADRYLPIAPTLVPTGDILPVEGTPFDFRTPRRIGERIRDAHEQLARAKGYDHAFMTGGSGLRPVAWLEDPASGRALTVHTTQPAIQLYTGNTLDGTLSGAAGRLYRSGDAVCLEAQHPQDSPNNPNFPSTVLQPGHPFHETIIFAFDASAAPA